MPTPKPPKMTKARNEREKRARENATRLLDAIFSRICDYAYGTRSHMPNGVDYTNFTNKVQAVGKFCHARPDWTQEIVDSALVEHRLAVGGATDDAKERDDMELPEEKDSELVVAIVKAAIGEADVYFRSYFQDQTSFGCNPVSIEVTVGGEVTGKLMLTGKAAEKVMRVSQISRKDDDLRKANRRADALSKKLKQLHALSDSES